jgi:hypothetical protein
MRPGASELLEHLGSLEDAGNLLENGLGEEENEPACARRRKFGQ